MTKITRVGDAGVQMTTNPMARVVTAGGVKATAAAVPAAMATTGGGGGEGGGGGARGGNEVWHSGAITPRARVATGNMTHPDIENPRACTRCVFCLLRFLTIPSTPMPHGTEKSTCCSSAARRREAAAATSNGSDGEKQTATTIFANQAQIIAGRFLIALFVLDYGAVAVGRIMHYDALDMASSLGLHFVLIDIAMTTIEACAEFVGTSITPFVFKLMYPRHSIESRQLARFAVRIYAVSNLLAFLVYPIISGMAWLGCNINATMLILLISFRTLQYSVINQIGDAAVQMAKPHWLRTFAGTSMQIPGFDLGGCYIRTGTTEDTLSAHIALIALFFLPLPAALYFFIKDQAVGRLVMATLVALAVVSVSMIFWANDSVLSCGVQVEDLALDMRAASLPSEGDSTEGGDGGGGNGGNSGDGESKNSAELEAGPGGHSQEGAKQGGGDRANGPSGAPSGSGCITRCQHRCGYGHRGLIWITHLKPFEQSIIVLYVLVKVINEQLTSSLSAVVLVSMGTLFTNTFIVGSGFIGMAYLLFKICTENRRLREGAMRNKTVHSYTYSHRLVRWLRVLLLILVFVIASALLLLLRPPIVKLSPWSANETLALNNMTTTPATWTVSCQRADNDVDSYEEDSGSTRAWMTIFAVMMVLPLYPAIKMFDVEFDSFMMDYERTQPAAVTSMQFWTSILSPIVHILMFAINYLFLTNSMDLSNGQWDAISVAESGTLQVAIVMVVSVTMQVLLGLYFGVLDRMMPASCSVHKSLAHLDKNRGQVDGGDDADNEESAVGEINRRATYSTAQRVKY
jgi:hypothetical protein